MKKLLAVSLALSMMFLMTACGNNPSGSPSSSGEGSSYEDVLQPTDGLEDNTDTPENTDTPAENEGTDSNADGSTTTQNNSNSSKPSQGSSTNTSRPGNSGGNSSSSNNNNNSSNSGNNSNTSTDKPAENKNYAGTLPELISAIYAKQPVDLMLSEPTAVDLSDADAVTYYLGLSDASKVKEAYFSETMIGSQAYSLVVVRTNSAADAPAVAQSMFDGINQSKWICVTADCLAVGAYGDTVMLAMADSSLSTTLHTDLRAAYASAVGGTLDVSLERTGT